MVLSLVATLVVDSLREDALRTVDEIQRIARKKVDAVESFLIDGAREKLMEDIREIDEDLVKRVLEHLRKKRTISYRGICNPSLLLKEDNQPYFFLLKSYDYPDDSRRLREFCSELRKEGLNLSCYGIYGLVDFVCKLFSSERQANDFIDRLRRYPGLNISDTPAKREVTEIIKYWGYQPDEVRGDADVSIITQYQQFDPQSQLSPDVAKSLIEKGHILGYRILEDYEQTGALKVFILLRPRKGPLGGRVVRNTLSRIRSQFQLYKARLEGLYVSEEEILLEVLLDWYHHYELNDITNLTADFPDFDSITYLVAEVVFEDVDYYMERIEAPKVLDVSENELRRISTDVVRQTYDRLPFNMKISILGDYNKYSKVENLKIPLSLKEVINLVNIIAAKNDYIAGLILTYSELTDQANLHFIRSIVTLIPELDSILRTSVWRIALNKWRLTDQETANKLKKEYLGGKPVKKATMGELIGAIKKWNEEYKEDIILEDPDMMSALEKLNYIRVRYIHKKEPPKLPIFIEQEARYSLENATLLIQTLMDRVGSMPSSSYPVEK